MHSDEPVLRRLFFLWLRTAFFRFYCRLSVSGVENLPSGPFLLCANHSSHLDGIALAVACKRPTGRIALIAARDYFFENRLRRAIVECLLPLLPIDRQNVRASLDEASQLCRSLLADGGEVIIMFPAGTRAPAEHWPGFRRGAAVLACDLGIALVPAFIDGTQRAMAGGRWWPRPHRISIRFGAPIASEGTDDTERRHWSIDATKVLEERVMALRAECDG